MREVVQETAGVCTSVFLLKPADQDHWGRSDPRSDVAASWPPSRARLESTAETGKGKLSKTPPRLQHAHLIFSTRITNSRGGKGRRHLSGKRLAKQRVTKTHTGVMIRTRNFAKRLSWKENYLTQGMRCFNAFSDDMRRKNVLLTQSKKVTI